MAEARKNGIVIACSVIACIVTLLTCGTLIGNMQGDVRSIKEDITPLQDDIKVIKTNQTDMKTKQAFLEGVVSTKLDTIQTTVSKMEKQVDGLMRTPHPVTVP